MRKSLAVISAVCAVALASCNTISSIIHDDKVVARVGDVRLFQSDLEKYIPSGVSAADSASLAGRYILSWATEILYADQAQNQLTDLELDVTEELESYRRSILKYRYEQSYIADRLDTLVTEDQIEDYYRTHLSSFTLDRPVLKLRFLDAPKDAPHRDRIVRMMSSRDYAQVQQADTLATDSGLRYIDSSDDWMDIKDVAALFGTDWNTVLGLLNGNLIKISSPGGSNIMYAYVVDIKRGGTAPVEFCSDRIREYVLSERKHALVQGLERDLLEDARENNKFVIYK